MLLCNSFLPSFLLASFTAHRVPGSKIMQTNLLFLIDFNTCLTFLSLLMDYELGYSQWQMVGFFLVKLFCLLTTKEN